MTGWGPLFFLWMLFSGGMGRGSPGPRQKPPPGPHDFPPMQATPVSYGGGGGSTWKPYKPLTAEVIARAQALLNDSSAHEVIEPDPSHPGQQMRYLRTTDNPPGHTSVTAWMLRRPVSKPRTVQSS